MIRKVLFVDDDQILRAAIEQRLERYSEQFQLITAVDGFDAVIKLKHFPVSLVITDLVMPRMDGVSLIDHLRQTYPDLPIIIVSGIGNKQVAGVAHNNDTYGYLSKPFQADDLVRLIEEVLYKEAEGGIMKEVSPPVFIQLMEMDARTCTIRMLDNLSERGGVLHFKHGVLHDARVGEVSGLDAAHQIFSWDRATIFINNECSISENRINSNLGSIIMKAVGMKDETEVRPEDYDEKESIASLSDGDDLRGRLSKSPDSSDRHGQRIGFSIDTLKMNLKGIGGIKSISHDVRYQGVVDQLSILGEASGYGQPVTASLDEGSSHVRILVPARPPAIIKADSKVVNQVEIVVQQNLKCD